jgi:hypothetical protein
MKSFLIALILVVIAAFSAVPAYAQEGRVLRSADGLTTVTPFFRSITTYKPMPNRSEYSMLWQVRTVTPSGRVVSEERLRVHVMGCDEMQGRVWSEGNDDRTYWTRDGNQLFDAVAAYTCTTGWLAREEKQNAAL